MASPKNNVYTFKEFMKVLSIQDQTDFQKSPDDQSRRRDDDRRPVDVDDHHHPLVTEMFGELYFRESPNSSLDALFAAIDSRAAVVFGAVPGPAAVAPVVNAPPRDGGGSGDNGDGDGDDHTPEQASSSAPN